MRWLDGITDSMDVSLSELRELVMDRVSHVPPWCASILDLKVEAVQGKQFPWNGLRLLQDSGNIDMTLESSRLS